MINSEASNNFNIQETMET